MRARAHTHTNEEEHLLYSKFIVFFCQLRGQGREWAEIQSKPWGALSAIGCSPWKRQAGKEKGKRVGTEEGGEKAQEEEAEESGDERSRSRRKRLL